jgi:acetoacetyl-CoA reductase/3-oxoacyl-[acyl-carrier protein] reductase
MTGTVTGQNTTDQANVAREDPAAGSLLAGSKLLGRVAFVTGGTRGIGAAICRSLASQGAAVGAGYSGNDEAAERFRTAYCNDYPDQGFSVHKGDIGNADDCRRTIQEVIDRHGRLDILVNNAGITADRTVLKMTDDDWRKVIDVNLSGAFFLSQAALRHMLERGTGRIINISSVIGEMGNIGQSNYASAKSGLFGLTKTLAREACFQLQRSGKLGDGIGLTVNTVTPGYIGTEMVQAVPEKVLDTITAKIPMGRLGRPEEVARIVHFLAADASGYITGQVWGVNGGLDM